MDFSCRKFALGKYLQHGFADDAGGANDGNIDFYWDFFGIRLPAAGQLQDRGV